MAASSVSRRRREHTRSRLRAAAARVLHLVPVVGQGLRLGGLAEGLPPGGHGRALAVELPEVLVAEVGVRRVGLRVERAVGQQRPLAPLVPRPVEVEGRVLARRASERGSSPCRRGRSRRRPRPTGERRTSGPGSPPRSAARGGRARRRGSGAAPRPPRSAAPPARRSPGSRARPAAGPRSQGFRCASTTASTARSIESRIGRRRRRGPAGRGAARWRRGRAAGVLRRRGRRPSRRTPARRHRPRREPSLAHPGSDPAGSRPRWHRYVRARRQRGLA